MQKRELISNSDLGIPCRSSFNRRLVEWLKSVSGIDGVNALYWAFGHKEGIDFVRAVLDRQQVCSRVSIRSMDNLPETGGCVLVANRPYGILDGLLLMNLLAEKRNDVRFFGNFLLSYVDPIRDYFIELDPFTASSSGNLSGVRRALEYVQQGGCLVVFPSEEVSTHQSLFGNVQDGVWGQQILRFVRKCRVPVIPVFIGGGNSALFHWAVKMHDALGTAMLLREFLRKQNLEISVKIGKPITLAQQNRMSNLTIFGLFLRANVYLLGQRDESAEMMYRMSCASDFRPTEQPVAESRTVPVPVDRIGQVVSESAYETLRGSLVDSELESAGSVTLYNVESDVLLRLNLLGFEMSAQKIPGRRYLLMLDHAARRVVMGFELILGAELLAGGGSVEQLGSYKKFEFSRKFNEVLGHSIEVTSLYMNPDYEQRADVLKLFWSGMLMLVRRYPWCETLMGIERISSNYSMTGRMLIMSYLKNVAWEETLSKQVVPRHGEMRRHLSRDVERVVSEVAYGMNGALIDKLLGDLAVEDGELSRMPLMQKRYLALGGRVVSINVDVEHDQSLDLLLIIGLRQHVSLRSGRQFSEK